MLPEVGLEGQQRLRRSSALLVGVGGLGSPVALYLAAAGVGRLGLVDSDSVDTSNLHRQVLYGTGSHGNAKVEAAAQRLRSINPLVQLELFAQRFDSSNARQIATGYDVIIDGSDNFPTRYLANDVAALLGIPYVFGSIFRFDGQVSVFDARTGPCYRCLLPEPPPPGSVPSCAEGGVLGVLPGVIGSLQATEALKLLLGIGEPLIGRLILYDALSASFDTIRLKKNPNCVLCGKQPSIKDLIDYEVFCGNATAPGSAQGYAEVTPAEARKLLGTSGALFLDVREPHELHISSISGALNIPLGDLPARVDQLDKGQKIIVFCKTGVRAARAMPILLAAGCESTVHLAGGINAWAREVDTSQLQY